MSQFKKAIGEGPYKCIELGKLLLNEKHKAKYQFMSEDDFRQLLEDNMQEAMRVYWLELFYRSHMGAFSGLKRFLSWVDIVENSEHNYISYCSGLRGLMESCGDTYHGLSQLAVAMGDNKAVIKEALAGKATSMTVNSEFEDLIIHFTHASKSYSNLTKKKEHKPKDSKVYVSLLESGSNIKFYDYYGVLCEVTHPASDSLGYNFEEKNNVLSFNPNRDKQLVDSALKNDAVMIRELLMRGANPIIVLIKTINLSEFFWIVDQWT